jgi:hypothetical protein
MLDTRGWNPKIHDERLWGVFQIKLGAIRAQMFRNWEVCKSPGGYKLSAQPLVADPQTRLPMAREPLIAIFAHPSCRECNVSRRLRPGNLSTSIPRRSCFKKRYALRKTHNVSFTNGIGSSVKRVRRSSTA